MTHTRKSKSIYTKLILLVLAATVVAFIFFLLFLSTVSILAEKYYSTGKVSSIMRDKYSSDLQDYVNQNKIASDDEKSIDHWLYNYGLDSMLIVKDGKVTYTADSGSDDDPTELEERGIESQTVQFADGEAQVYFEGMYSFRTFTVLILISIACSFIVFLIILLVGVRQKIKRIQKMEEEVGILQGGNLDYEITVRGYDEIENLSRGINDMRFALKEQIEKEQKVMQNSRDLVTEISHDLRTPLTAILLYSEMLRKHSYRDETQMQNYVDRISVKANQLKVLTDNLFEFALVGQDQIIPVEVDGFRNVFYDLLSSFVTDLNRNGFECTEEPEWQNLPICFNSNYLHRILDNLSSNIMKYADETNPIIIRTRYEEQYCSLVFQNRIATGRYEKDRNHIGLKNINKMMEAMEGFCDVTKSLPIDGDPTIEDFTIALRFRKSLTSRTEESPSCS